MKDETILWALGMMLAGLIILSLFLSDSNERGIKMQLEIIAIKSGLQQCPNPKRPWQLMWQKECKK